ncbi:MAG: formate/nitrite family transporter [Actinomycetota bacterium]|nr:formate/nitrite family transporter [Actinomycetota bacterium]
MPSPTDGSFDALLPAAMAAKAEQVGVSKAALPLHRLVPLGVLAGAFIGLGAHFSTVVTAGGGTSPGVARLLGGLVFSLGLILVVVSGAELFTGNTLIVIACADRKVALRSLLRNWAVVYVANFVGATATSLLVVWSGKLHAGDGSVGKRALDIAASKSGLSVGEAVVSGVLANCLVCLAVWMTLSAHSLVDKIAVIIPPITAFVAAGFEHSVANMYFFPTALLHRAWAPDAYWATIDTPVGTYHEVSWSGFLVDNLLPVTVGNIIGGALLVGLIYWFVYLRTDPPGTQP